METWSLAQGSTLARILTFCDENSNAVSYSGSQVLDGSIWIGGSEAEILSLGPPNAYLTWVSPSAGTAKLLIPGSVLTPALFDIGLYHIHVTVDGNDAFEAGLNVQYAPGTQTPPRVYCSYEDVLEVAKWITQVQDPEQDQAGFLAQRVQARNEMDDVIVYAFRGTFVGSFEYASLAAMQWGGGAGGPLRGLQTSYLIRQYLNGAGVTVIGAQVNGTTIPIQTTWAPGYLMRRCTPDDLGIMVGSASYLAALALDGGTLGPNVLTLLARCDRPQTNRIAAYRAAALIGFGQIGVNAQHAQYGAYCDSKYQRGILSFTAEIDTNLTGFPSIPISCGSTNPLFT
jgi:hypothetical protein